MRKTLGKLVSIGGFVALGGVAGYVIAQSAERIIPQDAPLAVELATFFGLVLSFYVIAMLHIALHEAGHGICGALTGYRFVSYRIFGLMWIRREDDRIHFARFSLAGTGGQCLMEPPDPVDGSYPVVLYNMGGSLANLIAALVSIALALALPQHPLPQTLLMVSALVGIGFALMNGVPLRTDLVSNDGMNTLELVRSPLARRSLWVQMRANANLARGRRLRDLPADWFEMPAEDEMKSSLVASLATLSANRLMDEGRLDETVAAIEGILEHPGAMPEIHLRLLWCDLATCLLLLGRRDEAAALMDDERRKALKPLATQPAVLRTTYALALLADGDPKEAKSTRERFERVAKSYPSPAEVAAEHELIALVDAQAAQSA